jgi:hypothetical protein
MIIVTGDASRVDPRGRQVAGLLAEAAALAGALAGQPEAEAACADAAPDRDGLDDLHVALAVAAADLDDAIAEHAGILRP